MRTILSYADGREVLLRRRKGACPQIDLQKEARKGLTSIVVEDEGGPQFIAFNWGAAPRVHRDPFLAGSEVFRESSREARESLRKERE
jgi:hypothetical protein